jgi:menaquinone-dependent protoporphyrinogen oxidase
MTDPRRILVLFASTHGQTRRIAERIAATLREHGLETETHDVSTAPDGLSPKSFDGVLIGASVHAGHHQQAAVDYARHHHSLLNSLPCALFSVSLTAADDDDEAREATRKYLDDLLDDTGWQPTLSECFAGAILYSHYGVFERTLIRLIMRQKGHGDVKWDQEFTDWEAVDRFARDFASAVGKQAAATLPRA